MSIHASICAFVNQESSPGNHCGGLNNILFSIMVHLSSVIVVLAMMNQSACLYSLDVELQRNFESEAQTE